MKGHRTTTVDTFDNNGQPLSTYTYYFRKKNKIYTYFLTDLTSGNEYSFSTTQLKSPDEILEIVKTLFPGHDNVCFTRTSP